MPIAEILLLDFDSEIDNTRRTLERIPENDPQWKPHEKSMAIGRLALHTARLPQFCTRMVYRFNKTFPYRFVCRYTESWQVNLGVPS
jgi:DNA topoisomerase VI subunit B